MFPYPASVVVRWLPTRRPTDVAGCCRFIFCWSDEQANGARTCPPERVWSLGLAFTAATTDTVAIPYRIRSQYERRKEQDGSR